MKVVNSKLNLKRRIDRFFSSELEGRKQANIFLGGLAKEAHIYIFGGMLRDISLLGVRGFCSDIDVVFDGNRTQLLKALRVLNVENYKENRFGGYRIKRHSFDFDIWCVEDTWAFKQNIVSKNGIDSLLNTTLMNWDAILYHYNEKDVLTKDYYLNDLSIGLIDIILERNPNEIGALVRILRTIYGKSAAIVGERMVDMLRRSLNRDTTDQLIAYERSHYAVCFINNYKIQCLNEGLRTVKDGDALGIRSNILPKQLPFDL